MSGGRYEISRSDRNGICGGGRLGFPAPGGGSVSALAGAIGAALTAMVSGLTVGRKKYAEVQELVTAAQTQGNALRTRFLDVMGRDTQAF